MHSLPVVLAPVACSFLERSASDFAEALLIKGQQSNLGWDASLFGSLLISRVFNSLFSGMVTCRMGKLNLCF